MTSKAIGPSFEAELKAAGVLGLPFSWGADGAITFGRDVTDEQKATVMAVYAAHDPSNIRGTLRSYAEKTQVRIRDGGIRVNVGTNETPSYVYVATDGNGRGLVTGCAQLVSLAQSNNEPAPTFPWVNNDGSCVTLTASQIMAIGYAVGAFVQNTYATLGEINEAIEAGSITTTAQISSAAWPANS